MGVTPVKTAATPSPSALITDTDLLNKHFPVSPETFAAFASMEAAQKSGDSHTYQALFLAYVDDLRARFDSQVIDCFLDLARRAWNNPNDDGVYAELQGHLFRSGLCDVMYPETVVRGRNTTEKVLSLVQPGEYDTVVDFGTGDGRCAIATAAKVSPSRLILTDSDPNAVSRARQNFSCSGLGCQLLDLEIDYRSTSIKRSILPGRTLVLHCFQPMGANGIPFAFLSEQLGGRDVAIVAGTHKSSKLPREGIVRSASQHNLSASIPWIQETASGQAHAIIVLTKYPDPPRA